MQRRGQQRTTPGSGDLKPLGNLSAGMRGIVRQLRGGEDFASRAAALGFTIGVEATVTQNYGQGPIIVMVGGARVALGRGEAAKIQVQVLSGSTFNPR